MKKVALVLSSGGARGLAHIGAIEALEQCDCRITAVAGCSMGALVGGMYAAGRLPAFKEWMQRIDRRKILALADLSFSLNHLVKGERIIDALKEVVPDVNIEELPLPYCAVATDWETGREVVFRKGSLYAAIRASISLPLFFSPVRRNGMILVDGGVVNPLPLDRVLRTEGDHVVAVNVSGHDYQGQAMLRKYIDARRRRTSLPMALLDRLLPTDADVNYYTLISRTCSLMIQRNAELALRLHRPDVLVDISMRRYGSFDYDKAERIAGIGRRRTVQALSAAGWI